MKMNEFVENGVKEFVNGIKDVEKKVGVLMVRKEMINGKEVKRMKMMEWNENVKDYVELGSSGSVIEELKNEVLKKGVFGKSEEKDLWWRMDEFVEEWKKMRSKVMKEKMRLKKEFEKNHPEEEIEGQGDSE